MRIALVALLVAVQAHAQLPPVQEVRYCGSPARLADGSIKRRADVLSAFKRQHPCPATGKASGACPGWAIDHVIPLVCGGCDSVGNLQWLPTQIKSAAGIYPKDRWEQRVYCKNGDTVQ